MTGSEKADQQKGVIFLSALIEMKDNRLMVPDNPEIPYLQGDAASAGCRRQTRLSRTA